MKLKEIGEFGFIDRVAPLGITRPEGVVKGIGDDCAVISLDGSEYLLVTTDMMVERVHFLVETTTADALGAKALATNISDIAACGGVPRDAFISLAVPDSVQVEWLDELYAGMAALAKGYGVNLLGGDTTASKTDLIVNIAVTGTVPREQVLFRHTARPGDLVVLTGPTGESGAGCEILLSFPTPPTLSSETIETLTPAHLQPRPPVPEGRLLAQSGACTAAIDVSDGLSSDLGHICQDSGVAAVLYEERIPVTADLAAAANALGKDPLNWILNGGEDYVLIAAIVPQMWPQLAEQAAQTGMTFYRIGEFMQGSGMELESRDGRRRPIGKLGWDHFR